MTKRCKTAGLGLFVALCLPFVSLDLLASRDAMAAKDVRDEKAPDFVLKDLQGRKFRLSENIGKPVLLIFGATWCPFCRDEIPRLKDIYANYGKRGLVMLNIDIQESKEKVSRFASSYKLPYRVLLDEEADVAESYGVRGVPTMVLIDKKGMIVCRQCLSVEPLIEKMLKKK
ncbi:MAG TPA: TlpA disulfide reductase family protein [Syntrophales bacterium]|nr:TlpA disulfide reductase family protein [Syntrophales bacterium]